MLRVGAPILSILALFQKRAAFLNRLCYKRTQTFDRPITEGQRFAFGLSTPRESVGVIEVKMRHLPSKGLCGFTDTQRFFKPPIHYLSLPYDPLPQGTPLPEWMTYNRSRNVLEGRLPADIGEEEFFVFVKDRDGVIQEHFILKVKNATVNPQDAENPDVSSATCSKTQASYYAGINQW